MSIYLLKNDKSIIIIKGVLNQVITCRPFIKIAHLSNNKEKYGIFIMHH